MRFVAAWAVFLLLLAGCGTEAPPSEKTVKDVLPADGFRGEWNRVGKYTVFKGANLYGHIDGGAEVFLELGFAHLEVQRYARGEEEEVSVEVYRMDDPAAALGMLVFMLALAGIPPTAGFMGKLYLFAAAVEGGYIVLTVIAVVMSAVSLYYYFRIVVQMYLKDGEEEDSAPAELLRDRWTEAVIAVCVVVTLVVGVYPAPVIGWAKSAVGALGLM